MTQLKAQKQSSHTPYLSIGSENGCTLLTLFSEDQTNRLTRARLSALLETVETLASTAFPVPLIVAGNKSFFSAGADLNEISHLSASEALDFAVVGQTLMRAIAEFPAPVIAAIEGYCMGGGLDLALACHYRIAAPNAIFGHRGAALGLITGWGGTQRLTRLLGRIQALYMFTAALKINADCALQIGLITELREDTLRAAVEYLERHSEKISS